MPSTSVFSVIMFFAVVILPSERATARDHMLKAMRSSTSAPTATPTVRVRVLAFMVQPEAGTSRDAGEAEERADGKVERVGVDPEAEVV